MVLPLRLFGAFVAGIAVTAVIYHFAGSPRQWNLPFFAQTKSESREPELAITFGADDPESGIIDDTAANCEAAYAIDNKTGQSVVIAVSRRGDRSQSAQEQTPLPRLVRPGLHVVQLAGSDEDDARPTSFDYAGYRTASAKNDGCANPDKPRLIALRLDECNGGARDACGKALPPPVGSTP